MKERKEKKDDSMSGMMTCVVNYKKRREMKEKRKTPVCNALRYVPRDDVVHLQILAPSMTPLAPA